MLGRSIAIALIGGIVASVVGLAVVALVPVGRFGGPSSDGQAVAVGEESSDQAGRFSGETGAWTVKGRLFSRGLGKFEIELRVLDKAGRPAADGTSINVVVSMPGHPMPPLLTSIRRAEPGVYWVAGEASMYGRWRARIALPDGMIYVPLDISS